MGDPQIIVGGYDGGVHNKDLEASAQRIKRGKAYKDVSTIMVFPTRGVIPVRVVESLMSMMIPMNQKFMRMFVSGMEVGEAYNTAVDTILAHPELGSWKYMFTVEEDNVVPPDILLRLIEAMNEERHYAAVGALYWTKGEEGQPMVYGDPNDAILNFRPIIPVPNAVVECNGLGQGATLFDLDVFREGKISRPWFKTVQNYEPGVGAQVGTQDLYCFGNMRRAGYRVACDTRVRVGHLDVNTGIVW